MHVFDELKSVITPLDVKYPEYIHELLEKYKYNLNNSEDEPFTKIDWSHISSVEKCFYKELEPEDLRQKLMGTKLVDEDFVIMEFGYLSNPIKLSSINFIINWFNLERAAIEGAVVISSSGKYVLEFYDRDGVLYSNFKIV